MKVLVATKERPVFDIIKQFVEDKDLVPALDTGRIYEAIPGIQIAIIDYDQVVSQPFSTETIRRLLEQAKIPQYSSSQFLDSYETYIKENKNKPSRKSFVLPPKSTIAFTSYSGGTGKTSLALDTALHFAAQTRLRMPLPVAVFEFTYGNSALRALVGEVRPGLHDLVAQPEVAPYQLQGVDLYPMDYDQIKLVRSEQVAAYCREQISHHVLTVVDAMWPHGLASEVGAEVDLWVVLTTPRADAIENARRLRHELVVDYGENKVIIAVNQMGGLASSLALWGTQHDLELPSMQQGDVVFGGRLGKVVLNHVYGPLWQEYEKARNSIGGWARKAFKLRS
jgi:hypothetical protein